MVTHEVQTKARPHVTGSYDQRARVFLLYTWGPIVAVPLTCSLYVVVCLCAALDRWREI